MIGGTTRGVPDAHAARIILSELNQQSGSAADQLAQWAEASVAKACGIGFRMGLLSGVALLRCGDRAAVRQALALVEAVQRRPAFPLTRLSWAMAGAMPAHIACYSSDLSALCSVLATDVRRRMFCPACFSL